jgi:hypothetical protein
VLWGIPCRGLLQHMLASGAVVYPTKAEGIVPKAAWHWDVTSVSKQSPWGTSLHPVVCTPSYCVSSMDGDHFSPSHVL